MKRIEDEIYRLKRLLTLLEKIEDPCPGKTLQIMNKNSRCYFCYQENGKTIYLGNKNEDLARKLQQKYYNLKLIKTARKQIDSYERILKIYKKTPDVFMVFDQIPKCKRNLIKPFITGFNSHVKEVLRLFGPDSCYEMRHRNEDRYNSKIFPTFSGYKVRSKDEVMIADRLKMEGLVFIYELPMEMDNQPMWPDFTIYNPYTGDYVFWEHFGSVDEQKYAARNFPKLAVYQNNGYIPGINLIITSNSSENRFTGKEIAKVISRIKENLKL